MQYEVVILPSALCSLARLPPEVRDRIEKRIGALASNPRPPRSKLLKGNKRYWCIRSGRYRVIYRIEDERLLILVVEVGHRKQVYRNLN